MDGGEYELVLKFDSDSPEFARGVEIGVMWATLRENLGPLYFVIHSSNVEMAMRVAERSGRAFEGAEMSQDSAQPELGVHSHAQESQSDEWFSISFVPFVEAE